MDCPVIAIECDKLQIDQQEFFGGIPDYHIGDTQGSIGPAGPDIITEFHESLLRIPKNVSSCFLQK